MGCLIALGVTIGMGIAAYVINTELTYRKRVRDVKNSPLGKYLFPDED